MGLVKPHKQNRESDTLILMGGMKMERRKVGNCGDECSIKIEIIRGDGKRLLSTLDPTFS